MVNLGVFLAISDRRLVRERKSNRKNPFCFVDGPSRLREQPQAARAWKENVRPNVFPCLDSAVRVWFD